MGKKIAVIDDDPVVRMLIAEIAGSVGHSVQTYDNGREALEAIHNEVPDLVFVDLMMPEMNGLEVLDQLKHDKETSDVPVVMLSADTQSKEAAEEKDLHADMYLAKPFKMNSVLCAIEAATAEG